MLTARSFAAKNGYDIEPDQDFAALGTANIASALSQGFAVSGADSRTAMSDAADGRTHAVGLVAAVAVALVLLFFTAPLQYVPLAALGAVLIAAALSLIDLRSLRLFYRIDRTEALLSMLATLGVVAVGAVNAILFAVILALLRFIRLISRPRVEILGKVEGFPGFHSLARHERGQSVPGLLLFRFNAPITFFNAPYFKRELLRAVDEAGPGLRQVVIDLLPIPDIDATGLLTITELVTRFSRRVGSSSMRLVAPPSGRIGPRREAFRTSAYAYARAHDHVGGHAVRRPQGRKPVSTGFDDPLPQTSFAVSERQVPRQ